jgi:hypothetical protein
MKTLIRFFTLFLAASSMQQAFTQTVSSDANSVSVQPILWLDSLVPTQITGFSAQYETAVFGSSSFAARAVWFRDPLFGSTSRGLNGYAFSIEYRQYLSVTTTGWHIGPFAEWIGYEYLGYLRTFYGSAIKSVFDVGVIAGHKWATNKLIFDISVRTSWYSPHSYPNRGYFPRLENSNFNSFMLLTIGYSIN